MQNSFGYKFILVFLKALFLLLIIEIITFSAKSFELIQTSVKNLPNIDFSDTTLIFNK